MNAEGRAIILWYTCLLLGIFGTIVGNFMATLSAFAAMICATMLVKGYRKEEQ